MSTQEIIYAMALTRIPRLSLMNARLLYDTMGSATAVFEHRKDIRDVIPEANEKLVEVLRDVDEAIADAEREMEFARKSNIRCLSLNDDDYPLLLKECPDAPLVLYYLGNADLNAQRIVNVVGTRKITPMGKDICRSFIADLQKVYPDTLVVSGLAYGVDVNAHRAALENGMKTVGVLAHGLDTIYPAVHRQTAVKMVSQGGLLTEYMSNTRPDKGNFVRRNRIVAGMSLCTIVVESAAKGGALITAELAGDYNREVCAFPGRPYDEYSKGCNHLIAQNKAHLISCLDDFLEVMQWENPLKKKAQAVQQELFPDVGDDEKMIIDTLRGADNKHINQIVIDTNLNIGRVTSALFELELKGIIQVLGGARYRLRH